MQAYGSTDAPIKPGFDNALYQAATYAGLAEREAAAKIDREARAAARAENAAEFKASQADIILKLDQYARQDITPCTPSANPRPRQAPLSRK